MPTPSGPAQRATEEVGREVGHRGVEKIPRGRLAAEMID